MYLFIFTVQLLLLIRDIHCISIAGNAYRPVVIWHGLGDSYDSSPMYHVQKLIEDKYPGIYTHSVYLNEDSSEDQRLSFFGNMTEHLEKVCEQLASVPELSGGFDAVGFSQGGLFLRAYAERCNSPPIKTLITYGSPHNGVSDLPTCAKRDFLCRERNALLRSQVWTRYAQSNIVSAQYFRDPDDMDEYLESSNFLADINCERENKNSIYAENFSKLERLVLVMFSQDETVIPKESAWFAEVNRTSGLITPLEKRALFKQDWIGIKHLGETDHIEYLEINGLHMQIGDDDLDYVVDTYLGSSQFEGSMQFEMPSMLFQ